MILLHRSPSANNNSNIRQYYATGTSQKLEWFMLGLVPYQTKYYLIVNFAQVIKKDSNMR